MNCPICSIELLEDYAFCPQCGSPLPAAEVQATVDSSEAKIEEPVAPMTPADVPEMDVAELPVESVQLTEAVESPEVESVQLVEAVEPGTDSYAFAAPIEAPFINEPAMPVFVAPAAAPMDSAATAAAIPAAVSSPAVVPSPKTEPVIPKEYKPLTTVGTFFYFILVCIPVVGFIALIIFAFGGKNKNRKSLSRALLIYQIIAILLGCIAFALLFFLYKDLLASFFDGNNWSNTAQFITDTFINY